MAKYFKEPDYQGKQFMAFYARSDTPVTRWYSDDEPDYPTAEIGVSRGGYDYGNASKPDNVDKHGEYDSDTIPSNAWAFRNTQLKMFETSPSVISSMFSDHTMHSHVGNLIGLAVNEANKIGTGLTYSGDLSEHSSKLARRGMSAGIVSTNPDNPGAHRVNDIAERGARTYEHDFSEGFFDDLEPVPSAEIKDAKNTFRGIVKSERRNKKDHIGPQFKHPDLDVTWHQPELGQ